MPSYQLEPPLRRGDAVAGDPANRGTDTILLGRVVEAGPARNLFLDITGEQVVAILGKRGTGKSYTLGVMLEGLAAGRGKTKISSVSTPRAGLVLDIMDIFWTSAIPLEASGSPEVARQYKRMDTAGFAAQPLAIDMWVPAGFARSDIDPPNVRELRIQASDLELDDWADLFSVDIFGEPRGMLIADLVAKVGQDGYTNASVAFVPANPDFVLSDLLMCLDSDPTLATNYRDDTLRSIRQRITSYAAIPLFQGKGTPLTDLMREFRVSVLMLARVPDELKKVIVGTLLKRILRERRDASFAQKRLDLDPRLTNEERSSIGAFIRNSIPRTWVLLDEAHVLAGSERSVAGEALVKYAKEGRNYGLSLAVATQQPSALDSRLTSQAETLIMHQLTAPTDAMVATHNIRSPVPSEIKVDGVSAPLESLLRRLGQGEVAFSCGNAPQLPRVCIAAIRPRVSAHGGYEA